VGAHISVRTAAEKMIATSDNMATDMLIEKVGPRAVDDALVHTGHHDPAAMTPFPTMYELFTVAWGRPDLREQWKKGTPQDRAAMLQQANSATYQPDPFLAHVPASEIGAEWYGSADDICRVHVWAQPHPSRRSWTPAPGSIWIAMTGLISRRKPVGCPAI